jgi:predicted metal-dependent hydrolase
VTADPHYRLRVSTRAKHVRLIVSVRDGGLTVVIPKGFDRRQIPEVLRERRSWIERARRRIAEQRTRPGAEAGDGLPALINLRAIGEEWYIEYRPGRETGDPSGNDGRRRLVLHGAIEDEAGCKRALRRWVHAQARRHLAARLLELGQRHALPVSRVTIRSQRTRWGSCSERNSVNLNEKLMFLPPRLVSQVMVHELCHTVHHNHSKEFWALAEGLSPGCREMERELRTAWRYVPAWVDG